MGVHWYAKSTQLIEVARQLKDVEHRIFHPDAEERAIEAALEEREALYAREDEARAELEQRGFAVTIGSIREWPRDVAWHVRALGPQEPGLPFLDLLGWGTDYYIENLRRTGVRMDAFPRHLNHLRVSAQQACSLGDEILKYASGTHSESAIQEARVAGLWLYFWGSIGCSVEAGQ